MLQSGEQIELFDVLNSPIILETTVYDTCAYLRYVRPTQWSFNSNQKVVEVFH